LGIPNTSTLKDVLKVLQTAEVVDVRLGTGGRLSVVRENVPKYGDLYSKVGDVFAGMDTTEVEDALIDSYGKLVEGPVIDPESLPVNGLSSKYKSPLLDVADAASLIRTVQRPTTGEVVFYTPQFWDERYDKYIDAVERLGDDVVRDAIRKVASKQGYAIRQSGTNEDQVMLFLANSGVLPSPIVHGLKGEVAFAFTPVRNPIQAGPVGTKIIAKARAILACVRYGEGYGSASKIVSPIALLSALRLRGKIGPHSDIPEQYKLLLEQGVCRLSRSTVNSTMYFLHFTDTDENKLALDSAIEILEDGAPYSATTIQPEIAGYALYSDFTEPVTARAKRAYTPSAETKNTLNKELIEMFLL